MRTQEEVGKRDGPASLLVDWLQPPPHLVCRNFFFGSGLKSARVQELGRAINEKKDWWNEYEFTACQHKGLELSTHC